MPGKLSSELEKPHFRVAIFGSARIKMGDERYRMVYSLAKKIAGMGMDIVTGGGPGLMDAASRGHHAGRKNNHAHSIGLTIRLPTEQRDSFHLDVKKDFSRFSERLDNFMALSSVVVVTPGGIGTLLEIFYTWQLVQVKHICNTPIILLGKLWRDFLTWIKKWPLKKGFINSEDLSFIFFAENINQAMSIIDKAHMTFLKRGRKTCLNVKKYGIVT
ncbi:LOG family protein [Candidatus Woesearchaeota archaeon]|nr:LOG family protein [Candidatus Woesearchaeota archaeon]